MPRPVPTKVFGSDYDEPDSGSDDRRAAERAAVVKQARHLANLRNDPDHLARNVAVLQQRRARRPDLVPFEAVPGDGVDAFVVPGELLVRRRDLGAPGVVELMADLGLEVAELEAGARSAPAVVRLVGAERDPTGSPRRDRMSGVVGELRRRRVTPLVSLRYLCPLGAVIKGEGGPEPSARARELPRRPDGLPDVVVAVVDTGISAEQRGDGWLRGLLGPDNEDLLDAIPQPDGALDLAAGHGTFVTGIVQQVAPHASLLVLRATDTDGVGTDSAVAEAVLEAAEAGARIINLSLGTQTVDDEGPLALRVALETLFQQHPDVLVVAAAGNYGDTRPCWPAAFAEEFPGVVSVGGLTASGVGAPWSSHGPWVRCAAVGEGVVSTYVIGTEDVRVEDPPDTFGPDSWATWTGTSFAAPQIAGAVARRCQEKPELTPREALETLLAGATPLAGFGATVAILPGT